MHGGKRSPSTSAEHLSCTRLYAEHWHSHSPKGELLLSFHLTDEEIEAHKSFIDSKTDISTRVEAHVKESFLEKLAFERNNMQGDRQAQRQEAGWGWGWVLEGAASLR